MQYNMCVRARVQVCPLNTTIASLILKPNRWRLTRLTSDIKQCPEEGGFAESACCGGPGINCTASLPPPLLSDESDQLYCREGMTGARCERCVDDNEFFDQSSQRCKVCRSAGRVAGTITGLVLGVLLGLYLAWRAWQWALTTRVVAVERFVQSVRFVEATLQLPAKAKIVMGFTQVWLVLGPVYGVTLPSELTAWMRAFSFIGFGVDVLVSRECVGSAIRVLLAGTLWPFALIAALQLLLIVRAFAVRGAGGCRPAHVQKLLYRSVLSGIPTFILVTFCVLPSVSRSIFETWSCESFGNDDSSGGTTAYMRTDLSVECGGEEHSRLASLSWALFALWPVLMPLSYLGLLYYCRESIQRHKPSYLSSSIRFLYSEYREQW